MHMHKIKTIKLAIMAIAMAVGCFPLHCLAYDYNRVNRTDEGARRPIRSRSNPGGEDGQNLFAKVKDCLALIQCPGERGVSSGSGFIAGGWLYTNEHVIRDASKIVAKKLNGEIIKFTPPESGRTGGNANKLGDIWLQVAKDRDLARIKIADCPGLNITSNIVDVGRKIWTFGNSDGGGVVTRLQGEIIGVGPDRIEVDIPFVQGNSGGAILTGEGNVCAVATYAIINKDKNNWVKNGTRFNEVRRFCLTLNDVQWAEISWNGYVKRCQKLAEIKAMNDLLLANLRPWPWDLNYVVRTKTFAGEKCDYRKISEKELKSAYLAQRRKISERLGESKIGSYMYSVCNADYRYSIAAAKYIDDYIEYKARREKYYEAPRSMKFHLNRNMGPKKPKAETVGMLKNRIGAAKAFCEHLNRFESDSWAASNLKKEFLAEQDLADEIMGFLKAVSKEDWVKKCDDLVFGREEE